MPGDVPGRAADRCAGDDPPAAGPALARHLALGRLDDDRVAEMVRACWPSAGDDVVSRVQRTADGVPFLVEEVLASPGVPASFRDTVRARLAGLDTAHRPVLAAAAVRGGIRLATARPGDRERHDRAAALQQGIDLLLLTVDDTEFRFRHALTRDAVLAGVLPPTRAELAAAALTALEQACPGLPGRPGTLRPILPRRRVTGPGPASCSPRRAPRRWPAGRWPPRWAPAPGGRPAG